MIDRKPAPSFSPLVNFQLPEPEVTRLPNGCNLVHLNIVKQDVIKIELLFKAGKWFEPEPGVAHFTGQLLDRGIPGKTAYQIATSFDLFGASVEINAGLDFTSVSLYSLASNVHETLPLFFKLLTEPIFPDAELVQAKEIFAQNLKLNLEKNSFVASRNIRKNIFGELHPYGATLDEGHLNAIASSALRQYFSMRFSPYEAYVTGPLSESTGNILKEMLGRLIAKSVSEQVSFSIKEGSPSERVEKAESVQTSIRIGKRSINRAHENYPKFILLNHILGGYFGSRLMKNLREDHGLTYGIHSSVSTFVNDSVFMIGTDVNKQDQALAIDEIRKEIEMLCSTYITDAELALARNHLLGGLQLDAANPFSIMDKIKMLRINNLNTDYYHSLFDKITDTNSQELKNLAIRHFNPETFYSVSVG
jgi:zinc protease